MVQKEIKTTLEAVGEVAPIQEKERESNQLVKFEGENLIFD